MARRRGAEGRPLRRRLLTLFPDLRPMDAPTPDPTPDPSADLPALIRRVHGMLDELVPAMTTAVLELYPAIRAVRGVAERAASAGTADVDALGHGLAAAHGAAIGSGEPWTDPLSALLGAVHRGEQMMIDLTNVRQVLFMVETAENDPAARRALYALIHDLDGHGPN